MYTNEDRVASIDGLVSKFCEHLGPGMHNEDPYTQAGDMIGNLLHWVQAQTGSREEALRAVRSGLGHYVTETYIDYSAEEVDELGPDAFITLEVNCNGQTWNASTGVEPFIC